MNILEFVEDVEDETRGTRGKADKWPVLFEDKEGIEHQIGKVELLIMSEALFLIERKDDEGGR